MTPAPAPAGVFLVPPPCYNLLLAPFPRLCHNSRRTPKGGRPVLGENIKALRKARGLSQQELAGRLHVVRQTVSKWEQGGSLR